jgi:hypothetical protein
LDRKAWNAKAARLFGRVYEVGYVFLLGWLLLLFFMTGDGVFSAVRSMARLVTLCLDRKFEMQNKGVCRWSCWLVAVSFMTESEAFHFFVLVLFVVRQSSWEKMAKGCVF